MIKTLRLSFSLKNTYRVNSILYAIKQLPILKKLLPDAIYQIEAFKILANILSVLWAVLSTFLGKLLYFLLMINVPVGWYEVQEELTAQLSLHILVLLSMIGAFMNTYMFIPTKDKYYAMILLGMEARKYTLANYFFSVSKVIAGFVPCVFLFGGELGFSLWQCLLIPFFVAGMKLVVAAFELWDYEKRGAVSNENKRSWLVWVAVLLLLALAYAPPVFGVVLPEAVSMAVMCLAVAGGGLAIPKIMAFGHYRAMYKELLADALTNPMDSKAQAKLLVEQSHKNISVDTGIMSNKKGFEYLNELFIKRHRKILWSAVKKISVVVLTLIAAVLLLFRFVPETKEGVNSILMSCLPYFVFVMYMINRGTGFTRALFVSCDHSLLTYPFYKQPRCILQLFQIRLREIIKVNLLPAGIIGAGLAILLYVSGGTDNPLNYAVLFVSIICLSIFFSVHYLMLYYLLQPYNAGTEVKSATYQVMMSVTYVLCYIMLQFKMPTLVFGIMTIIFCILYCIVASVLVYKLAPKTFRIRA